MAERRRHQRDGRAVVDRVTGVGMPQPVHGGARIDARALGGGLDDEFTARSVSA